MIRLSNKSESAMPIHYVDREVEHIIQVPVEVESQIVYVDREVIKEVNINSEPRIIEIEKLVEVPVIHVVESSISLETLNKFDDQLKHVSTELEMQRRALVAIKQQRDIDRSRRLMLIKRINKEHKVHKKGALKLKLAICASMIISIISLIIK